ncbi:unnamed protein product [Mytilus coruscus]|uniref:Reverse transcriptase/retrotransposon-derived protein RNase H-like domain-containing protein n=1 Tax=Mytilus coruscus TaxID=42192 RepID=A0A6J8C0T6_MYTCO|nr:unnamed protein product [Mytilus coruscus]
MDKITFMGHIFSRNGIGPTQERVKDMLNATEPANGSEMKSFLGLVNYSARYIPNLATLSEPLRKLTKKNEAFRWGKEQQEIFEKLKLSLSEGEILGYYRLDADKTQLKTDASNVGLGAVLVQENKGISRVISYANALSRLVAINKTEFKERNVAEEFVRFCAQEGTPKALTTQEIEKESKVDTELSEVRKCLQQAKWNQSVMSAYHPVKNELSVIGHLLLRGRRIIIPKTLQLS